MTVNYLLYVSKEDEIKNLTTILYLSENFSSGLSFSLFLHKVKTKELSLSIQLVNNVLLT